MRHFEYPASSGPRPDQPDGDFLNPRDFIDILRRRQRVIFSLFFIGLVATFLFLVTTARLFTSSSQILVAPSQQNLTTLNAFESGMTENDRFIDSQVEVIRSRELAARVIDRVSLRSQRLLAEVAGEGPGLVQSVRSLIWPDAEAGTDPAPEDIRDQAIDRVQKALSVRRMGQSSVIRIAITANDPEMAAALANAVTEAYLADQVEWRQNSLERASGWLDGQLVEVRQALADSEQAVETFRAENNLVDAAGETLVEQQRAEVSRQLVFARAEQAEATARFRSVKQIIDAGGDAEGVAEVLTSNVVANLRQQQALLTRRAAELSARYGARHPKVVDVEAEMQDLQSQIDAEVQRILANLENEASVARTRVSSLETSLAELEGEAVLSEQAQIELRQLEREAAANRQLYGSLLEGYKESAVLSGSDSVEPVARKISEATVPGGPSHPNVPLVLALGLMLSGAVGVGAAFPLEMLDKGFRSTKQLEDATGLPHLSSIPLNTDGKKQAPQDVVLNQPLSAFTEGHRKLRAALELANVDEPPKVVLLTSSLPKEGKSTTTLSLGRVAAKAGLKTLLIDCDLRRPSIYKLLEADADRGLTEVLSGKMTLDEALLEDARSGLHLLLNKRTPPNPTDLAGSKAMGRLLKEAAAEYDLVLLDSAPVLAVTDTPALSKHADAVVFFVRWEETPRPAVVSAVKALRYFNAPIAGAAFTMVDLRQQARHGRGDSEYYFETYAGYYSDEGEPSEAGVKA